MEFCVMLGDNKAPEDQVNLELVTWNHEEYLEDFKASLEAPIDLFSKQSLNFLEKAK